MPGGRQVQHGAEESGQPWAHRDRVFRVHLVWELAFMVCQRVIWAWGHRAQPIRQCRHHLPPWDFTSTPYNLASCHTIVLVAACLESLQKDPSFVCLLFLLCPQSQHQGKWPTLSRRPWLKGIRRRIHTVPTLQKRGCHQ